MEIRELTQLDRNLPESNVKKLLLHRLIEDIQKTVLLKNMYVKLRIENHPCRDPSRG